MQLLRVSPPHAVSLEEPHQREMKPLRQIHSQRRWRSDSGDKGYARHHGLLNDLVTDSTGDQQNVIRKGKPSLRQSPANDFVESIVSADVFSEHHKFAFRRE